MKENEVLMSMDGLKKMEEELEYLKTVRRKEVAGRIKQAIEFGDISENSEYEDAKNEQAFIEGSILALEKKLRNASIIDTQNVGHEYVSVGSTVCIRNLDKDTVMEYTIVGSVETNPAQKKISNESPVGKGLLGHKVGDVMDIVIPAGVLRVEVLEIK